MKKIFLIGCTVLFVLLMSPQQAMAAEDTFVDPFKVSDDPHDPAAIHVLYDQASGIIKLDKTDTTIARSPLIGVVKTWIENWLGTVRPSGDSYHIGTDKSVKYGEQLQKAGFEDLTPAQLQDITTHDTQPKVYCVTGRLCVADPETGKLAVNAVSNNVWCTKEDVPGLLHSIEGARRLTSFTMRNVQPSQDYTLANIKVKKSEPPLCGEKSAGDPIDQTAVSTVEENIYGENGDAISTIIYTITEQTVSVIDKIVDGVRKFFTQYEAKETASGENVMGGMLPWSEHRWCLIAGCPNAADLIAKYINGAQKKTLQQSGGIADMYRVDSMDSNYTVGRDATFVGQEFDVTIVKKLAKTDTTVYAARRTEEGQTFINCNLLTDAEQKLPANSAMNCNKSWVSAKPAVPQTIASIPPSSPSDTSAWARSPNSTSSNPISPKFASGPTGSGIQKAIDNAAAGKIPKCVLEGVAYIEGGYTGDYTCKPNECSAAGPFQITTGVGCTSACGGKCPNAKPKNMSVADMCDTDKSAGVAVNLLMGKAKYFNTPLSPTASVQSQRRAIINAGDSYYGSGAPVGRLGGLSYGEWVYAHCSPSETVTHVTHKVGEAK